MTLVRSGPLPLRHRYSTATSIVMSRALVGACRRTSAYFRTVFSTWLHARRQVRVRRPGAHAGKALRELRLIRRGSTSRSSRRTRPQRPPMSQPCRRALGARGVRRRPESLAVLRPIGRRLFALRLSCALRSLVRLCGQPSKPGSRLSSTAACAIRLRSNFCERVCQRAQTFAKGCASGPDLHPARLLP